MLQHKLVSFRNADVNRDIGLFVSHTLKGCLDIPELGLLRSGTKSSDPLFGVRALGGKSVPAEVLHVTVEKNRTAIAKTHEEFFLHFECQFITCA